MKPCSVPYFFWLCVILLLVCFFFFSFFQLREKTSCAFQRKSVIRRTEFSSFDRNRRKTPSKFRHRIQLSQNIPLLHLSSFVQTLALLFMLVFSMYLKAVIKYKYDLFIASGSFLFLCFSTQSLGTSSPHFCFLPAPKLLFQAYGVID